MSLANLMLFLPMAVLLVIGVIETVVYFVKKRKNASVTESASVEVEVATTPQKENIDELKKYKELLDQGIITQEEFDAKKKQILGL
jgi:septation ring formation regulator EzrA